jgi:Transcriptional regulator
MRVTNKAVISTKDTGVITGTLRIGSVELISTAILPDILLQFHRACPEVEIVVHTTGRDALIDMARNNNLDLFFTLDKKINASGLKRTILREEKIIFVTSAHHKMCNGEKTKLQDFFRD